jgi:uncharacterized protein with von Willebrand factor type A (vWA) domain
MHKIYLVKVYLNEKISDTDIITFIKEAVETWGGGTDPQEPLFDGIKRVKVERYRPALAKLCNPDWRPIWPI